MYVYTLNKLLLLLLLLVIRTPAEKGKTNLQYKEYQKESKKLLDFCGKMMGNREREADSIELEQPEGVPKVKEISKEKLNEKLNEIIDQPQYVRLIGENTLPPYYSREMSRYEPPNRIKQKEREDLLEKVREMTSEESKGSKRKKLVEVDTHLSWDHEGLGPLPKSHKDRLNGSPKPPRVPTGPKVEENNEGTLKKECPSFRGDYNEDRNDKKKYRDTGVSFENDSYEESDTEDSYELEITPQQLSQVTPGGGALKIKLSKKKPIKITAGAPKRESGTVPMKPENIKSSKQSILSSHTDASSESTQTKRGVEAPLLITPKHLGNNVEQ